MSKVKETANKIRDNKVKLFAEDNNSVGALEFAHRLAKAHGMHTGVMTTAIMVYHNTLIEVIAKEVENEES